MSRFLSSPYLRGRVIQPDDDPCTIEALLWLLRNHIRFVRKTRHHLKIGPINYFPTTGRIVLDGHGPALPERGLAALQVLLLPAPTSGSVETSDHMRHASGNWAPPVVVEQTSTYPLPESETVQTAGADALSLRDRRVAADSPPWAD